MIVKQKSAHTFTIEIDLTPRALALVIQRSGDDPDEMLEDYLVMESHRYGRVTRNPSFDLSFGAEINDILSIGLLAIAKRDGFELELGDLSLHPFRIKLPVIDELKMSTIDGEIDQKLYQRITLAIDTDTGQKVTFDEKGNITPVKD